MTTTPAPDLLDLLLIGGGHSHVEVLRQFAMRPLPGLRITLLCRDVHTPYSGMLPGLVAGHYDHDEAHIDLRRLARAAGANFVHAEASSLDAAGRCIGIPGRPPMRYDLVSINIGSTPAIETVPGAAERALPVKPVAAFLAALARLEAAIVAGRRALRIAVVGGGAGGVELALALQYRFRHSARPPRIALIARSIEVLHGHNVRVRQRFQRVLIRRGIELHTGYTVTQVDEHWVHCGDHSVPADAVVWATQASAPAWLGDTGLALDVDGFVRVDRYLRSQSHAQVFAAGDIAALPSPRPKSGVFAVRAGSILATNLRRAARARRLRPFRAQRHALALISTGDRYAVASRGPLSLAGAWLWPIKNAIDCRFMRRYRDLPAMGSGEDDEPGAPPDHIPDRVYHGPMRCGGCGAKVGATVLTRVLRRIQADGADGVEIGLTGHDDAAVFAPPAGRRLVQSIDYLRDFLGDPFLLGQIAAEHALNDLYAMGATPHSALALASVPFAAEAAVEERLYQLLAGASQALSAAGAALLGGHSSEGSELGLGLSVTGSIEPAALLRKPALAADTALILTQPLGTGVLFAADMRGLARGEWIVGAAAGMCQSNAAAARCLHTHGASAATDVSGFGLIGHLANLLAPANLAAEIDIDSIPLLPGAATMAAAGVQSSLAADNLRSRRLISDADTAHPSWPLLFDPQTAGGLLAAIPSTHAAACLAALHECGYWQAVCIGHTRARLHPGPIRLLPGAGRIAGNPVVDRAIT